MNKALACPNAKTRRWFPRFLVLYQLATYMANDMYIPALPTMAAYFGCTREAVEWTVISFCAGSIAWVLWLGLWAERWGRRACLLLSGAVFVLSSYLCTQAHSIHGLIVYRFLQGSVICCVLVAGYATIQELYADREALSLLGKMTAVATLAPALGPVVGACLLQWGSWKLCFYAVLGVALIGVLGLYKTMPDEKQFPRLEAPSKLSLRDCTRGYITLLKTPAFTLGALLHGGLLGAVVCWIMLSPALLLTGLGVSLQAFGWLQVPAIGGLAVASWLLGHMIDHFAPLRMVAWGTRLAVLSALGMAVVLGCAASGAAQDGRTLTLATLVAGITLLNIGAGLSMPATNRILLTTQAQIPMVLKTALSQFIYVLCMIGLCAALNRLYSSPPSFCYFLACLTALLAVLRQLWERYLQGQSTMDTEAVCATQGKVQPPSTLHNPT